MASKIERVRIAERVRPNVQRLARPDRRRCRRNSLRKLLDFASRDVYETFRIDLDIVQSTLFMTRHEESSEELAHEMLSQSYGHNFEKACTEYEERLAESTGYL